jgi:hypothetical protein
LLNRIEKVALIGVGTMGGCIALGITLTKRMIPDIDPSQTRLLALSLHPTRTLKWMSAPW